MEMVSNYEVPIDFEITSARGNVFGAKGVALVDPNLSVDLSGVTPSVPWDTRIYAFAIGGSLYSMERLARNEAVLMSGRPSNIVREGEKGIAVDKSSLVEVETLQGKKLVHFDLTAYDYRRETRLISELTSAYVDYTTTSRAWKGDTYTCPHCGSLVLNGYHCGNCEVEYNGEWVLESTLAKIICSDGSKRYILKEEAEERGLSQCDSCGAYIEEGSEHPSGLCAKCLNMSSDEENIEEYGDSHDHNDCPNFIGNFGDKPDCEKKAFGWELEVDKNRYSLNSNYHKEMNERMADEIGSLIGYGKIRFACDGSLSDGFEIISQPHSPDAFWARQSDWAKMLDLLSDWGYRSHNAETCGLHVHLSRAWFGKTDTDRSLAIAKLFSFFYNRWEDIAKASRRRDFGYCHRNETARLENGEWVLGDSVIKWRECAKKRQSGGVENEHASAWTHGVALNNGNRNTVEIRVGRGTLNKASFFAWIDFCLALARNSTRVTIPDCEMHGSAVAWLKGIRESTARYLWKKDAFRKEIGTLFPEVEWENDERDSRN